MATLHKGPPMLIHKKGQWQWYISNAIDRVSQWKSELWAPVQRKPTRALRGKPVLPKYFRKAILNGFQKCNVSLSVLLDSHLNNRRKKSLVGGFIYWVIPSPRGGGFILGWEQQSRSNLFPYFPPLYCQQIFPTRLDATPLIEEFGFKKTTQLSLKFRIFCYFHLDAQGLAIWFDLDAVQDLRRQKWEFIAVAGHWTLLDSN